MQKKMYFSIVAAFFLFLLMPCTEVYAGPAGLSACKNITASGSYILNKNITVPASNTTGNCFLISADNVTIDLNGFTIKGIGTGTGIGNPGESHSGITVINGTITNFSYGVAVGGGSIRNCIVYGNTAVGILVDSGAVRGNMTYNNSQYGIYVGEGIVKNNTANNNDTGIFANRAEVDSNNAASNTSVGIRIECPSRVNNNVSVGNGTSFVYTGSGCVNTNNVAP